MAKEAIVMCGKNEDSWKTFEVGARFILQHSLIRLKDVDPKRTVKLSELYIYKFYKILYNLK